MNTFFFWLTVAATFGAMLAQILHLGTVEIIVMAALANLVFYGCRQFARNRKSAAMKLEAFPRTELIAVLAIGLGLGYGIIPSPRTQVAEYFASTLGDGGGFVAGLFALAITGAIAGLVLHAVFKRLTLGQ